MVPDSVLTDSQLSTGDTILLMEKMTFFGPNWLRCQGWMRMKGGGVLSISYRQEPWEGARKPCLGYFTLLAWAFVSQKPPVCTFWSKVIL